MGPRQLSCYRSPDPRILSRRRRIWSRGGRTRRPDVGRRLSPQPETQHPPVGGEVLIGLVASRLRRPDQTPSGSIGVGHYHNPHGATDQPARGDRQSGWGAVRPHAEASRSIPPASLCTCSVASTPPMIPRAAQQRPSGRGRSRRRPSRSKPRGGCAHGCAGCALRQRLWI